MWMTIFFELLVAITQFYHLLYNEAQLSKESPPILSAIHIGLMFGSLAFVVLPFAVWGVLSIRAVYCLPYLLFCFVSMFEVLALFVFGLVDYE
jgi:hypothetical protein